MRRYKTWMGREIISFWAKSGNAMWHRDITFDSKWKGPWCQWRSTSSRNLLTKLLGLVVLKIGFHVHLIWLHWTIFCGIPETAGICKPSTNIAGPFKKFIMDTGANMSYCMLKCVQCDTQTRIQMCIATDGKKFELLKLSYIVIISCFFFHWLFSYVTRKSQKVNVHFNCSSPHINLNKVSLRTKPMIPTIL